MTVEPARFGMPDANTAGVPAGIALAPYTGPMTITSSGTVVEGKTINGQLTVKASNVTIRNCRIQSNDWWGVEGEKSPNLHVENCDIIGGNMTNSGILGSGTFIGNDISHVSIGIQLTSNEGGSTIRDNYVHDLFYGITEPHYDALTMFGGQDGVVVEHNTFSVPRAGGTASIIMGDNFGPVPNNVRINNNLLLGNPSYAIYVNGTNVALTNNYIMKGAYGYFVVNDQHPPTMSGNVLWDDQLDPTPYPVNPPVPPPTPIPIPTPINPPAPSPTPIPSPLMTNRFVLTGFVVISAPLPFSFSIIRGKINLMAVDAKNNVSGDQAFSFLGKGAFNATETRTPGRLRYHYETDADGNELTVVDGTTNTSSGVDFSLYFLGHLTLTEADFNL